MFLRNINVYNHKMAKHHPDLIMCRKQPGVGMLGLDIIIDDILRHTYILYNNYVYIIYYNNYNYNIQHFSVFFSCSHWSTL